MPKFCILRQRLSGMPRAPFMIPDIIVGYESRYKADIRKTYVGRPSQSLYRRLHAKQQREFQLNCVGDGFENYEFWQSDSGYCYKYCFMCLQRWIKINFEHIRYHEDENWTKQLQCVHEDR